MLNNNSKDCKYRCYNAKLDKGPPLSGFAQQQQM
jgi:hypothetical protein